MKSLDYPWLANYFYFLGIFSLIFLLTIDANAQALSEQALFSRCYSQLTGQPVPRGHPLMASVKATTSSAVFACNSLLDKTTLKAGTGMLATSDADSARILNNLYSFHKSWFPANVVEQIQGYNDELGVGTRDIYDTTEPALAVTNALFAENAKYSDTLTMPTGVHGIRLDDAFVRGLIGWTVSFPGRSLYGNNPDFDTNLFNFRALNGVGFDGNGTTSASVFLNVPKIETGELSGIRATTETFVVPNVSLAPLASLVAGDSIDGFNFNYNLYQTLGGGVLGSPLYLLLNFGHEFGLKMNGQTKVPRRWAKTTMETFLCATLPALRESDVTQFLATASTAPFRNSVSCLQCHGTLDQMAYTARNVILTGTDFSRISAGSRLESKTAYLTSTFRPDFASETGWPSEPIVDFHRQKPTGRLYFRSFADGQLINKSVQNISELGMALSLTNDYYQCASKRYFKFFTGIDVALYDRLDPRFSETNRTLSNDAIADRIFVEKLAVTLKSTQSVKAVIKEIMASGYYRSRTFRP